jgi:GT2 family glycosyltransferase
MPMSPEPLVSVVVPVRNEERTIARCLAALRAQDYPADRTEILVVDGMSDDRTREIVAAHPGVRLLDNPRRHAGPAMNVGIAAARGAVIARVDGHAIVPPDFLSRCVRALRERPDVECASGALETRGRSPMGAAIAAAMSSPAGVGTARFRTGAGSPCLVDTVAFPVYPSTTLARLGPFDEELVRNQDDELNLRLTRRGGKILLLPDVRIVYFCQDTLRGLWRQYLQYGFWKVRVIQKHGAPASWRHLVPGTLVAALVAAALVALVAPAWRPAALALPAAYAAGLCVIGLRLAGGRPAAAARIAAAVGTLHLAYGIGFWKGVAAFAGRGAAPATASRVRPPSVGAASPR